MAAEVVRRQVRDRWLQGSVKTTHVVCSVIGLYSSDCNGSCDCNGTAWFTVVSSSSKFVDA